VVLVHGILTLSLGFYETRDAENAKRDACLRDWVSRKLDVNRCVTYTDMPRLTTGIRSEKCVVRRVRRCPNFIECTYTNLDSIAYYTPRLYGITYCC